MDCPCCHSANDEGALSCCLCGEVLIPLGKGPKNRDTDDGIGTSYGSNRPDDNMLKIYAARARRFMILGLPAQAGLVAMIVGMGPISKWLAGQPGLTEVSLPTLWATVALYGLVLTAWLVGKTASAVGLNFWRAFGPALLPPLVPGVLSRIAGTSLIGTYAFLTVDILVGWGAWTCYDQIPVMSSIVLILLVPMTIYHLTGCSIPVLAQLMGVNHYFTTCWVCFGPLLPLGIQLYDTGLFNALVLGAIGEARGPMWNEVLPVVHPEVLTQSTGLLTMVAVWAGVSWLLWIRAIYTNLKYPLY